MILTVLPHPHPTGAGDPNKLEMNNGKGNTSEFLEVFDLSMSAVVPSTQIVENPGDKEGEDPGPARIGEDLDVESGVIGDVVDAELGSGRPDASLADLGSPIGAPEQVKTQSDPSVAAHSSVDAHSNAAMATIKGSILDRHLKGDAPTLLSGVSPSLARKEMSYAIGRGDQALAQDGVLAQGSKAPLPMLSKQTIALSIVGSRIIANGNNSLKDMSERLGQDNRALVLPELRETSLWDVRPVIQAEPPTKGVEVPRQGPGASAVQQVRDALRHAADRPIEISLSPAELGRVRLVLSASDQGMSLNILAERPETLDLMRRNIDDLHRSLKEIGYEQVAFSFGTRDETPNKDPSAGTGSPDASDITAMPDDAPENPNPPGISLQISSDGIDIRI